MHLDIWQWAAALAAAVVIGLSKTCLPGAGVLVVSLLAFGFKGREALGIMTPMLIIADVFAVYWYRQHTQWKELGKLVPGVLGGIVIGAVGLVVIGRVAPDRDILRTVLGVMLVAMTLLYFVQHRLDERLTPRSPIGIALSGIGVGFSTIVSNAAGSVMSIYLAAKKMPKKEFMGTVAWFFFILNVIKLPVYAVMDLLAPSQPFLTVNSLLLPLYVSPGIILGVFAGKRLFPRIPQKLFERFVVILGGIAGVKLIIG